MYDRFSPESNHTLAESSVKQKKRARTHIVRRKGTHMNLYKRGPDKLWRVEMVRPEGVEPPTYWFVASCSIQLSYGRTLQTCCN